MRNETGSFWHPFADMSRVQGNQLVLERGEGAWVWDSDGKRYFDATAALWYCNVGHGRERLADVARDQMAQLAGYQTFGEFANEPALALAEKICGLAELGPHSAAFFTSGGSDGVETAAKIARRYWHHQGAPERTVIVAREGAYHGTHGYGTSLSGIEANATGWGNLVPDIVHVPRADLSALERVLAEHRGHVAAFIGEPVQGAGGVHPPPPEYWRDVHDLCEPEEVLIVADEVVTGFGRVGEWFASKRYEIEPDMIIVAKGLSSGYIPIGAVVAAPRIVDLLWSPEAGVFRHGYTYSGHPAASAVALENIKIIEEEDLVARVAELEPRFGEAFRSLAGHPAVREVRSAGLLAAVQLTEDALSAGGLEGALAGLRSGGVLSRGLVGHSLHFSPPFVITEAEIAWLTDRVHEALDQATP